MPLNININVPNDKSMLFRGRDHHVLAQLRATYYSFAIESKLVVWSNITIMIGPVLNSCVVSSISVLRSPGSHLYCSRKPHIHWSFQTDRVRGPRVVCLLCRPDK